MTRWCKLSLGPIFTVVGTWWFPSPFQPRYAHCTSLVPGVSPETIGNPLDHRFSWGGVQALPSAHPCYMSIDVLFEGRPTEQVNLFFPAPQHFEWDSSHLLHLLFPPFLQSWMMNGSLCRTFSNRLPVAASNLMWTSNSTLASPFTPQLPLFTFLSQSPVTPWSRKKCPTSWLMPACPFSELFHHVPLGYNSSQRQWNLGVASQFLWGFSNKAKHLLTFPPTVHSQHSTCAP